MGIQPSKLRVIGSNPIRITSRKPHWWRFSFFFIFVFHLHFLQGLPKRLPKVSRKSSAKNNLKIFVFLFGGTNKLHVLCETKAKDMTNFKAIVTEKGSQNGQTVGNTKNGAYKGMSKEQFEAAVKKSTCLTFVIVEI